MIFPTNGLPAETKTQVKICGITNLRDAVLAVELGADALGLNFYSRSVRCLSIALDAAWLSELPAGVRRVAVVVNASLDEIDALIGTALFDAVQLHGDEDEAFCSALRVRGIPFIKAVRARDEGALWWAENFATEPLLLDAYHPEAYGGTGQAVDWSLAARFAARHPQVLLAGGLRPDNVADAIRRVRPFGVDTASGVEQTGDPRRKDAGKLREFFAAVRAVDAEISPE